MRTTRKSKPMGPLLGALALLGVSSVAQAQSRPVEYQIIVLDASGSMLDPSRPNSGAPNVNVTKWDEAFNQISLKLTAQKTDRDARFDGTLFTARNHCIAVWAFASNWVRHVYPLPTGVTTPINITGPTSINNGNFRCTTDTDHHPDATVSTLYDQIINDLAGTVQNNTTVKPQTGAPSTPLARATCLAIRTTRAVQQNVGGQRRVLLLSDGLENATPASDDCAETTPSGTPRVDYSYNATNPAGTQFLWAGGALSTQWEHKIFNTAIFNSTTPGPFRAGFTAADLNTRPTSESFDDFLARILPGTSTAIMSRVLVDVFSLYDYIPGQANIPARLQDFFDDLAVKTKGATQRVAYGANYPVPPFCPPGTTPGDVDCNGFVDDADYNMLTQPDVWRLPVIVGYDRQSNPPILRYHDLRNKCDFNRDGVVNGFDEDILLNNYGTHP